MTFTALHFISHSASSSPSRLLFRLPSIIPRRSEGGGGVGGVGGGGGRGESRSAYKQGVLGQAANAGGKDVSR